MSSDILPDDKFIVIAESVQFGIIVTDIDKNNCFNQNVEIQGSKIIAVKINISSNINNNNNNNSNNHLRPGDTPFQPC